MLDENSLLRPHFNLALLKRPSKYDVCSPSAGLGFEVRLREKDDIIQL